MEESIQQDYLPGTFGITTFVSFGEDETTFVLATRPGTGIMAWPTETRVIRISNRDPSLPMSLRLEKAGLIYLADPGFHLSQGTVSCVCFSIRK